MLFAVVDIETNGSHAEANGITEIAVVTTDGTQILDRFETLVNPQQSIPSFISHLTGITDQMVSQAPLFEAVIPELMRHLEGKVFVAHNVNFDYKFLHYQLAKYGINYSPMRLCTIKLSRHIFPGLKSYSLGRLAISLGVELENAHRAMGDAYATAEIFNMLFSKDHLYIQKGIKKTKEANLPAHLNNSTVSNLPESCGVYYFVNKAGKYVYIGKAKNIKKRVHSHFSGALNAQKEGFFREIYDIKYEETGTELIAALLEDSEIKNFWPAFNVAQKHRVNRFGVFTYIDQEGNRRVAINKINNLMPPLKSFTSMGDARNWLFEMVEEFGMSPSLCGLPEFAECNVDVAEHNNRVEVFMEKFDWGEKNIAIMGKGRFPGEQSFVMLEKGTYRGFGFVPKKAGFAPEVLEDFLIPQKESGTIKAILKSEVERSDSPYGIVVY